MLCTRMISDAVYQEVAAKAPELALSMDKQASHGHDGGRRSIVLMYSAVLGMGVPIAIPGAVWQKWDRHTEMLSAVEEYRVKRLKAASFRQWAPVRAAHRSPSVRKQAVCARMSPVHVRGHMHSSRSHDDALTMLGRQAPAADSAASLPEEVGPVMPIPQKKKK